MYLRRSAIVKYLLLAFSGFVLYSEWLIYLLQPSYFPELKCQDEKRCTKIIFVADPQIQGDFAVGPPLKYIFNWDSDRYLKSTFSKVVQHFRPHVVVYLGDLMDEGSIASMTQFHTYSKRLFDIFDLDYSVVQIWLPGDNDIGGENEPIKKDKVREFENIFWQPTVITYRNISFYKVNAITYKFPKQEDNNANNYRIAVSHYPVTSRQYFTQKVDGEIHPNIYFCAHEHESKYISMNKQFSDRKINSLSDKFILNMLANETRLYEIYVPTCSYRMGKSKIGFGAAIIENNNQNIRYTVFWSPQRFPLLYCYLALLLIAVSYCLVFCATRFLYGQPTSFIKSRLCTAFVTQTRSVVFGGSHNNV